MIYLYSGTPGSGKSLHQASDFYYGIRFRNELIVCNYEMNMSLIDKGKGAYLYLDNLQLTPQNLRIIADDWWKEHKFSEGGIRLYIDEAQMLFNARQWDAKDRAEWNKFFTVHRHYGYDIYLVAQFDRMIDRQIRSLIEYEVIHRKVSNFGLKGKIISLLMGGNLFVAVKMWYPMHERVGSEFFRFNKKFARLYDSYKRFDVEEQAAEGGDGDECNTEPGAISELLQQDCVTRKSAGKRLRFNKRLLRRALPILAAVSSLCFCACFFILLLGTL